jgi:hypothetical protein
MSDNRNTSGKEYTLLTLINYVKNNLIILVAIAVVIALGAIYFSTMTPNKYQTNGYISLNSSEKNLPFNLFTAKELVDSGNLSQRIISIAGLDNRSFLSTRARINDRGNILNISLIDSNSEEARRIVSATLIVIKERLNLEAERLLQNLELELKQHKNQILEAESQINSLKKIRATIEKQFKISLSGIAAKLKSQKSRLQQYEKEREALIAAVAKKGDKANSHDSPLLISALNQINDRITLLDQDMMQMYGQENNLKQTYIKNLLDNDSRVAILRSKIEENKLAVARSEKLIAQTTKSFTTITEPVTNPSPKGLNSRFIIAAAFIAFLGIIVILSYVTWILEKNKS